MLLLPFVWVAKQNIHCQFWSHVLLVWLAAGRSLHEP
jgi:hypothetical protein